MSCITIHILGSMDYCDRQEELLDELENSNDDNERNETEDTEDKDESSDENVKDKTVTISKQLKRKKKNCSGKVNLLF